MTETARISSRLIKTAALTDEKTNNELPIEIATELFSRSSKVSMLRRSLRGEGEETGRSKIP